MSVALTSLGWDDFFAATFEPFVFTHTLARAIRAERGVVDCVTAEGVVRARVPLGHDVVTGDWVALCDGDGWWVDAVLPRRTSVVRAVVSGRSESQVLAANVDVVFIAVSAEPEPRPGVVERLLALAWDSGATPVVVVTKVDLIDDTDVLVAQIAEMAPGVEVIGVSAVSGVGVDALRSHLGAGRTGCLLGRSGAGKSTLVNALVGEELLATAEVRDDGKGRHTTTRRELVALPGGGALLDTPGLRGAGLAASDEGIERAFADVEDLVAQCRFADCAHVTEPGCAVLLAVDEGRLPERRLESWRKLQREARWMASRTDARLRAEQRRAWKLVHLEVRRSGRIRP